MSAYLIHVSLRASNAGHHLGSPIRRIAPAEIESLRDTPGFRIASEAYHTGKALIEGLSIALDGLQVAGMFLAFVGVAMIALGRTISKAPACPAETAASDKVDPV